MTQQRLELVIEIDGKRRTLRDLDDIRKAVGKIGDDADRSGDALGGIGEGIGGLSFAFNNVLQAAQTFFAQVSRGYDLLIGQNTEFRQGLLQSASTLAANSDIFSGDQLIENSRDAILALQGPLEESVRRVELATRDLVGVTERETTQIFNTILSNSALLAEQSQEFPDSIRAAESLVPGLTAALGTLQIPIFQASQEVRSLLQGQIDPNAALANALQISRQDIERARSAGELVDFLNGRFETFVEANRLAAESIPGITSNIQGLLEVLSRDAGTQLERQLVEQLSRLQDFLLDNEATLQAFAAAVGRIATDVITPIGDALVDGLIPALFQLFEAIAQDGQDVDELFEAIGRSAADGIIFLSDAIELLSENTEFLTIAIRSASTVVDVLNGVALVGLVENIQSVSESFGNFPPVVQRIVDALSPLVSGLDLTRDLVAQLTDLGFEFISDEELDGAGQAADVFKDLNEELRISQVALRNLGSIEDQGLERFRRSVEQATAGIGNTADVAQQAKTAISDAQQFVEQGILSPAEAIAGLRSIANEETLAIEERIAAQRALTQLQEQENDRRLDSDRAAQAEVNQLVASGEIRDIEGQRRVTALRAQELDQRLSDIRAFIDAEVAAGRGDGARAQQLIQQERDLQTQLVQARADAQRLAREQATDELSRQVEEASALIQEAETERSLNTQQLLNDGVISQREADSQRLDSVRRRITGELAIEQQRAERLQSLPTPNDPEERDAAEREIRQSLQRTAQLQLQLLENERQQQEQLADEIRQNLEDQITLINRKAQFSQRALDAESSAIQRQNQLLSAQNGLINAQFGLQQTEGQIRVDQLNEAVSLQQQLADTEDRGVQRVIRNRLRQLGIRGDEEAIARQIAQQEIALARQQVEQFNQQAEARRAQLEIEIQLEQIAQRRLEIESRLSLAQAQNQLAQAETITDPEARERAVTAANDAVILARDSVTEAEKQEDVQAAIADLSRQTLEIELAREQAQVRATAESEIFAANLRRAQVSAEAINESLANSRGGGIQAFREGGTPNRGLALVGEEGPELVRFGSTARVFSNPETQRIARKALTTTGIAPSSLKGSISAGSGNNEVLRSLGRIEKALAKIPKGVTVNGLSMPQSFSLPRDERQAAREAARVMRNWERDLGRLGE